MQRYLLSAVVCIWLLTPGPARTQAPGGLFDQAGKPPTKVDKKAAPRQTSDTLEQHIAEALKNNPDILVAQSKVREADAELARTRLKVISDLTLLHNDITAAHTSIIEAEGKLRRAKQMVDAKVVSSEEYEVSVQNLARTKAVLASLSAKLSYLLGKPADETNSSKASEPVRKALQWLHKQVGVSDEDFLRRTMLDVQGRLPTPAEMKQFLAMPDQDRRSKWLDQILKAETSTRPKLLLDFSDTLDRTFVEKFWRIHFRVPDSPLAIKLRDALDTPVRLNLGAIKPLEAFDFVREKMLPGINVVVRAKSQKQNPVSLWLPESVPVGAALQYVEDQLSVVFVLRDYGIVVVAADERIPPGAVSVIDFWKHGTKDEQPAEKAKSKQSAPPAK